MDSTINGVISKFEGDMAIISFDGGQKLDLPRAKLPTELKEGSNIKFKIQTDKDADQDTTHLAKSLLNEIFKAS
ncbi:MAG: DUF3006 domain-containing protein [Candidatus Magasanikbacteria bacterium]|nr:DUF3006 domain-containing protein [Candidatus Magasanikbacteria bacterium]